MTGVGGGWSLASSVHPHRGEGLSCTVPQKERISNPLLLFYLIFFTEFQFTRSL